jgi:WD40 repeat protein
MTISINHILTSHRNTQRRHAVTGLAFAPRGYALTTSGLNNTVLVWDWRKNDGRNPTHYLEVTRMSFSLSVRRRAFRILIGKKVSPFGALKRYWD